MSQPIIEVENLSKRYRLGQFNARTLREEVERLFRGGPHKDKGKVNAAEFWALRDISFTVQPGEVVGILGRNGAGKSTLLKILSRVTEPTSGVARIRGRVASLLEVGTGFHPELTGRENIYLNGAILGMTRAEIKTKFDDIVAFAEIERFLDTPVKRYSSGMYVRLAFAVAAHLDPEILLVDEVLAVGDAEFQKKCLGKMDEVAGQGRTVLFVSHNLAALRRICGSGILLTGGRMAFQGEVGACIEHYSGTLGHADLEGRLRFPPARRDEHHVIEVEILDDHLAPMTSLRTWEPAVFLIRFYSPQSMPNAAVTFQISTMDGSLITFCATTPDQGFGVSFDEGENQLLLRFDSIALSAGKYVIGAGLAVANTKWLYNEPQGVIVEVAPKDVYDAGFSPTQSRYPVPMACRWQKVPSVEGSILVRQSRT